MSLAQPHFLVVDHKLPARDVSAGSLRLFELIRGMRSMGAEVTAIACESREFGPRAAALEALGVETGLAPPSGSETHRRWFERLCGDAAPERFDVAWLSYYYVAEEYLSLVRQHAPGTRIVVDTVDVHSLREARQAKLLEDPLLRRQALRTREREQAVYRCADAVVVVSEPDREAVAVLAPGVPVSVIPTIHEPAGPPGLNAKPFQDRQGILFVGNFHHPPNVDALEFLHDEILPHLWQELPEAYLIVVGHHVPESARRRESAAFRPIGRVPEVEPYLQQARVSVAPVRYGAGVKGKIGQSLAAGLPVVTTPAGAEGNGFGARASRPRRCGRAGLRPPDRAPVPGSGAVVEPLRRRPSLRGRTIQPPACHPRPPGAIPRAQRSCPVPKSKRACALLDKFASALDIDPSRA